MKGSNRILALATGVFWPALAGVAGPRVDLSTWGTTPEGIDIPIATLESGNGVRARVAAYGALLVSVETPDREGRVEDVTLSYRSLDEALDGGVFGSVIGRFANRIDTGGFEIDGVRHELETVNRKTSVHIHGGRLGFHRRVWEMEKPSAAEEEASVTLRLLSPDGEEGYPGTVRAEVAYTLTAAGVLRIRYRATTTAPTVVNLTNHAYFNLSGSASGDSARRETDSGSEPAVVDHLLELRCPRRLELDGRKIPTGRILPVEGTPFDFTQSRRIGETIPEIEGGGYDHCFVLPGANSRSRLVEFAVLLDPASGREMRVATTKPGVQIYTANHFRGNPYPKWGGICFETQYFPDSPNQPDFPSPLLRPGETYDHTTEFRFSTRD